MEGVSCEVCGLKFNDAESCAAHQAVCSEEVFDMMLGDVGKWFVSDGPDGTMLGRIVGVRNCFGYDVRSITYREGEEGELTVVIPPGVGILPSDRGFTVVTMENIDGLVRALNSNIWGHVFQDTECGI